MTEHHPPLVGLLRVWGVLVLAYAVLRLGLNLVVFGWLDLRPATLLEVALVPLGMAWVYVLMSRSDDG